MGNQGSWTSQLNFAVTFLGTGPGVIVAALMAVLLLLSFVPLGRWIVVSLLLFSSTVSMGNARALYLIAPLAQIRRFSEVLTVIFLGFLLLPALLTRKTHLKKALLGASIAFWLLEVFYALRVYGSIDFAKAFVAVIIYTSLMIVLAYGLPRWLRNLDDMYPAIRCMGFAAVLFVAMTALQLLANPSAIVIGGRLFAITGNPQYAAMVLAICLTPVCFLVASPQEGRALRIMWGATAGMVIVFLIWTGSRTGVLMALVGIGVLFRTRLGRLVGTGVVVAAFVFAFLAVFQVSSESSSRILNTLDTRSAGWNAQLKNFAASPFIGVVSDIDYGTIENSYLTVAARSGLVGLSILAAVLALIAVALRRLSRIRAATPTPELRMLADFVTAGILSILAGAFFEGILVGTLTFMLLALYFYLGLLKFLTDAETVEALTLQAPGDQVEMDPQGWREDDDEWMYDDVPDSFAPNNGRAPTQRPA